jgi:PTH1 family peptidyl-tRNA hydrolase
MRLFVGLGNPGPSYRFNRHNAGFLALDLIAARERLAFKTKKNFDLAESGAGPDRVFLLKPLTYMNESGAAVAEFLRFHEIPIQEITIISDDAALPVGSVRIRERGSDGGQKGLRDIIARLATDAIPRIRIGVGSPPPNFPLERWVLSNFLEEEHKTMDKAFDTVHKAYGLICRGTAWNRVMNDCNLSTGKDQEPDPQG